MGKSTIAGIALALSIAWMPAHAGIFGDTTNNSAKAYGGNARAYGGDASAKSRSSAKAEASAKAKASAKQKQGQKQGQEQSQVGIQVQKGTVTGNNEGVTGNSVTIGGSVYKEAAHPGITRPAGYTSRG